jgi:hypothetical protein
MHQKARHRANDANMNATTTPTDKRLSLIVGPEERALFAEFQAADKRRSLADAIVALALLGYAAWKTNARPAGQVLVPVAPGTDNPPTPPEAA